MNTTHDGMNAQGGGGYGPPGGPPPGAPPGGYGPPGGPPPGAPPGGYGPPGGPPGYGGPGAPGTPPGGYGGPPGGYGPPGGPPGAPGGYGPPPGYGGGYQPPPVPTRGPATGPAADLKKQATTWLIVSIVSFFFCGGANCFGLVGAILCFLAMQAADQNNLVDGESKLKWGKIITIAGGVLAAVSFIIFIIYYVVAMAAAFST